MAGQGEGMATPTTGKSERYKAARLATVIAAAVNVLLSVAKVLAGIFGNSAAMLADGIHSAADLITDATRPTPQNSYGAQKLMLEEFYADLARRGMISSRSVRLMTVSVRPGKPNAAASSFLSGMIREPLQGESANVPVDTALRVVLNSPTGAVDGLMHAMSVTDDEWGAPLGLNLPGISVTVGEMVEALREVGGEEAVARLSFDRDEAIERIVSGWPTAAQSERAARLGFAADRPFIAAVRDFAASLERN